MWCSFYCDVFVRAANLKPGTGFKPPATHQGVQGPLQTALAYLGSSKQPKAGSHPGASLNAGLGELVAPSSIGAPSHNALIGQGAANATLNQICCRIQPADLKNPRILLLQMQYSTLLFPPPPINPIAQMC
ncbi:hypothetical protein DSO57_1015220 [Entomophthora muscae]|uniref:Uncharacterized protein n=1 Tax=Entomophthora muscae TaxID=34485 RepID=A0ACC2TSX4_9FUNG|nr:hypothetical protein DSO57_1015220 [Entomophthora muscae]